MLYKSTCFTFCVCVVVSNKETKRQAARRDDHDHGHNVMAQSDVTQTSVLSSLLTVTALDSSRLQQRSACISLLTHSLYVPYMTDVRPQFFQRPRTNLCGRLRTVVDRILRTRTPMSQTVYIYCIRTSTTLLVQHQARMYGRQIVRVRTSLPYMRTWC